MSRLPLLLVALLLCVSPQAGAAPPDELRGTLDALNIHQSGPPLDVSNARATGRLSIKAFNLRYRMFILMGEPCWQWEARYVLGDRLFLQENSGRRTFDIVRSSGSEITQEGGVYKVPAKLFDTLHVTGFSFVVRVDRSILGPAPSIVLRYPGLPERTGKWGWDTPGSPNWDKLFTLVDERPNVSRDFYLPGQTLDYLSTADAKAVWKRLFEGGPAEASNWRLWVFDVSIDASTVLNAIHNWEIRKKKREAGNASLDAQVQKLLADLDARQRAAAARHGGIIPADDPQLQRHTAIVQKAVDAFSAELSEDTRRTWSVLQHRRDDQVAMVRFRELSELVAGARGRQMDAAGRMALVREIDQLERNAVSEEAKTMAQRLRAAVLRENIVAVYAVVKGIREYRKPISLTARSLDEEEDSPDEKREYERSLAAESEELARLNADPACRAISGPIPISILFRGDVGAFTTDAEGRIQNFRQIVGRDNDRALSDWASTKSGIDSRFPGKVANFMATSRITLTFYSTFEQAEAAIQKNGAGQVPTTEPPELTPVPPNEHVSPDR